MAVWLTLHAQRVALGNEGAYESYVFDGRKRLLLLEKYNSENPSLSVQYKDKVSVLYYKFCDAPSIMDDSLLFQSMGGL